MIKKIQDLKILLLQIREDEQTMLEEYYEFVQFSELQEEQIDKLNVFNHRTFSPNIINGYDALFIGGSSDATVQDLETYDFIHSCKDLVRRCYNDNIPVLASCFGFQVAVEEFGAKVIVDKTNMEMGLYQIELMPLAKKDPLLYDCPSPFWAVSGHQERAISLPENALLLGSSKLCPYHIFTFPGKPFYAFQFHPEVDTKDLIARISRYQQRYLSSETALQKVIDNAIHQTTESNLLIKKFVERIILAGSIPVPLGNPRF